MIDNFITVFFQVLSLFLMMSFGFIGQKAKMITEEASRVLSDIVMYFVTPCLIINSFIREFDKTKLTELLITFVCAAVIHAVSILFVHLIFKSKKESVNRVLRFAVVFSNVGYMGIPLQQAVLGDNGVFFGSTYVAVFNLVLWSYGIFCMSGDKSSLSAKKLIINPGIIGTSIGLVIFLLSVPVPDVFKTVVSSMASLNTPLAMIVIGYFLAKSNFLSALKLPMVYLASAVRLLIIPLAAVGGLYLAGLRGDLPVSMIISASAPVAAATSMFASRFGGDTELASNVVAITTVLSILTMPLIVAFAQSIFY